MNIIRSAVVELSTIPAIAYKQKLATGGAGLRVLRLDQKAVAVFTLDRRTNQPIPYGTVDSTLFPEEAIDEAVELIIGLPYSARGKIQVSVFQQPEVEEDVTEDEVEAVDMVDSEEYEAIVSRYSDERGKINYTLLNKDFIQFAAKSKTVSDMVANRMDEDQIVLYILQNRAAYLSGKVESLNVDQTWALLETLDEIDPRAAFKELKAYLRRLLSKKR